MMIAEGFAVSFQEINRGNCDEFASRLINALRAAGNGVLAFEREINFYYYDLEASGGPLVPALLVKDLPDMVPPIGMDWNDLNAFIH